MPPLIEKHIKWCERRSGRFCSWNLALICGLADPEQEWFYLDMWCMSLPEVSAWSFRDDLSAGLAAAGCPHLTGSCINWLQFQFPLFLGQRHWAPGVPRQLHQPCHSRRGWSLQQMVVRLVSAPWIKSCACSFKVGVNKWWRMLDHIVAGTCERGRDPALGPFLKIICSGWSHNGNLGREKDVLGRSCSSGICLQLCVLQSIFKREVLKLIYCSWNLKCWFWGLFVSANCLRITSFPFCDSKLNESFNKLYENWVSLFS